MKASKKIMLVEDDCVDTVMVKRAMRDLDLSNELVHASDGEEAMNYMDDAHNRQLGLVLLDLNMPRMDGFEFLDAAKKHESFRRIPIVVLTTSDNDHDKLRAFENGAAGYMVKPQRYGDFVEMLRTVDAYWTLSELPEKC